MADRCAFGDYPIHSGVEAEISPACWQTGRLGKEKIKPLLDRYCKERGLKTTSESTIGNIIKRHKFFYPKPGKVYHDPSSRWARDKNKKKKRPKIKHPLKPQGFGHIVSDTVERVTFLPAGRQVGSKTIFIVP